ncbi:MAG: glycosyltransferase family 1 protein [Anaerolineae bacterium]|nr:glycosyltransferase family 4 protein [Thermoflexales bacterium]MDW8395031.1 glycosyltransferase family 1 protein [Anaerolineae bacterium]
MIVIDASPAVHRKAGLGRYAQALIEALVADTKEQARERYAIFYYAAEEVEPEGQLRTLPRVTTTQSAYDWRLRTLLAHWFNRPQNDLFSGAVKPRLFHATEHLLPRLSGVRTVLTLHDLIFKAFPRYHLPRNYLFLQLAMPLFLRRADAIICVSEHTKRDAVKHYRVPEEKIRVIYEGVEPHFSPDIPSATLRRVRERYHLPDRFVLFVGTIEPRKNLPVLFEAFQALREQAPDLAEELLIVGKQGWLHEGVYRMVHELGLTGLVRFVGRVDDEDLPALYRLASVMAFPSLYEGFGLPPLEAMACGTPVVASNAAAMPEVLGDAALLIPPTDPSEWTRALRSVLSNESVRRDLSQRGRQRAAQFDWQKTARATQALYQSLLTTSTSA